MKDIWKRRLTLRQRETSSTLGQTKLSMEYRTKRKRVWTLGQRKKMDWNTEK